MPPLVSICIPAYNNVSTLERLLHSITEQTFQDYEVIISDDSTNDTVLELVKSYNRTNFIYNRNRNQYSSTSNWNESIKLSRGNYIKVMHHDDWFTFSDSLEKMIRIFEKNAEVSFVFSGSRQVQGEFFYDRSTSAESARSLKKNADYLYVDNCIGAPSATMFKKTDLLFDEKLKWLVDVEFYIRYIRMNQQYEYTLEPLISIGISDEQVTNECIDNGELKVFEYGYVFEKMKLGYSDLCREKITDVFLCYHKTYQDLKKYDIKRHEYCIRQADRQIKKIKFLIHMIKEKVINGKSKRNI